MTGVWLQTNCNGHLTFQCINDYQSKSLDAGIPDTISSFNVVGKQKSRETREQLKSGETRDVTNTYTSRG